MSVCTFKSLSWIEMHNAFKCQRYLIACLVQFFLNWENNSTKTRILETRYVNREFLYPTFSLSFSYFHSLSSSFLFSLSLSFFHFLSLPLPPSILPSSFLPLSFLLYFSFLFLFFIYIFLFFFHALPSPWAFSLPSSWCFIHPHDLNSSSCEFLFGSSL